MGLFACLVTAEPYVEIGGLFVVCPLGWRAGRVAAEEEELVGRGGGGRLPKVVVWWFCD